MILIYNNLSNIYYLINYLLHPKSPVFRAGIKERNSPNYQKFFVYLYICIQREIECEGWTKPWDPWGESR